MKKRDITILLVLACTVFALSAVLVASMLGADLVSSSVRAVASTTASVIDSTKKTPTTMTLQSSAFEDGELIPVEYTCDGRGENPPLQFVAVPKAAKRLALIVTDPDVPATIRTDRTWHHWLVWDMPAKTAGIGTGQTPPGTVGQNTDGTVTYSPPCPPDREHRYVFTLYALDAPLQLAATATPAEVLAAMEGHILAQSVLTGVYNRR